MDTPAKAALQIERLPGSREGVHILKVHGPLIISNFFEFQQLAREDRSPVLIIDLADVPYVDSAALGCLLGIHVSSGRKENKYALVGVAPRIQSMFAISGVGDVLVVFRTLDEAEAALS